MCVNFVVLWKYGYLNLNNLPGAFCGFSRLITFHIHAQILETVCYFGHITALIYITCTYFINSMRLKKIGAGPFVLDFQMGSVS